MEYNATGNCKKNLKNNLQCKRFFLWSCLKTFDSLKRETFHSQRLVNAHDSCWYRQYSEQTKKVTTKKLGMFRQTPSVLLGLVVGPVWSNGMSHCTSGWFDVSRGKREGHCTLPTCNCIPQERRKTKQRQRKALHFCGGTFCFQMRDTGDQTV